MILEIPLTVNNGFQAPSLKSARCTAGDGVSCAYIRMRHFPVSERKEAIGSGSEFPEMYSGSVN